jgi:hypothetical protein
MEEVKREIYVVGESNHFLRLFYFLKTKPMTRTISDSERLVIAKLNRTETELKQAKDTITQYAKQLKAQTQYITELKDANKMLAAQVKYLVSKQINHA